MTYEAAIKTLKNLQPINAESAQALVDAQNWLDENYPIEVMPPYIKKGSFYYYLHIQGGCGNPKGKAEKHLLGGEFNFIVFYAAPSEIEGMNKCARFWCKEKGIVYGLGSTIEEAYRNYTASLKHVLQTQLKKVV